MEFRDCGNWYAQYVDVAGKVYDSESFVGIDNHFDIREDVEEHQNGICEETKYHTDVCQISGDAMNGTNAEVQQQERQFEGEHGRRVDYAGVFAQL